MGKKIREFMTHREPPEHIWMERDPRGFYGASDVNENPPATI